MPDIEMINQLWSFAKSRGPEAEKAFEVAEKYIATIINPETRAAMERNYAKRLEEMAENPRDVFIRYFTKLAAWYEAMHAKQVPQRFSAVMAEVRDYYHKVALPKYIRELGAKPKPARIAIEIKE